MNVLPYLKILLLRMSVFIGLGIVSLSFDNLCEMKFVHTVSFAQLCL